METAKLHAQILAAGESELISRLINYGRNAYKLIFDQNYKIVLNTCFKFVFDKDLAEDITQEVFIEVFKSIKNFKSNSRLSTWIYRIAVTKSLDSIRRQKAKKRFGFIIRIDEESNSKKEFIAADKSNMENKIDNEDRAAILNRALQSLPQNQRVAFTLSKCDELSYKEIASILDTTVSSVESLIHRAKKNLQKKLYNYYEMIL